MFAYLGLLHCSPSLPYLWILSSPNTNELFIPELMGVHNALIIMLQNCLYSRWLKIKKMDYFFAQPQKISCIFFTHYSYHCRMSCLHLRVSKRPLLVLKQPLGYTAHSGHWGIVTEQKDFVQEIFQSGSLLLIWSLVCVDKWGALPVHSK